MKIYPGIVTSLKFNNNLPKSKAETNIYNDRVGEYKSVPFLGSQYYMSFKGGEDLSLDETMQILYDAEARKNEEIIPQRVRKAVEYVVETGNPDDLALIDVHKNVYDDILFSESLDEVRTAFPEFGDVKSINEIGKRKGTFVEQIKSGENELFSPDEDFSLQLLKLYWANAYSLSDIEKYIDAKTDIHHVLSDLNIPRRHPHYAWRLKLSDSEYKERFTETLRLRQAQRYEKVTGGVYIPRGKLTDEQKKKISEGLINYYAKNPERVYLQPERHREFFKNNPECASFFSEVLFDAWRLSSSRPVKNSMKKFFEVKRRAREREEAQAKRLEKLSGKKKIKENKKVKNEYDLTDRDLADVNNLRPKQRVLLQEFWDTHPDERRLFGRSLTCAWARVHKIKESESRAMSLDDGCPAYPKKLADKMKEWTISKGYSPDSIRLNMLLTMGGFDQSLANKSMGGRLVTQYFQENPMMADIYTESLLYAIGELRQYISSHKTQVTDSAIQRIDHTVKGKTCVYLNEAICLYLDLIQLLIKNKSVDELVKLFVSLEKSYDVVINWRKQSGLPVPS